MVESYRLARLCICNGVLAVACIALAGCSDSPTNPAELVAALEVVGTFPGIGLANSVLESPFTVRALDAQGHPVANVPVHFGTQYSATVSDTLVRTDSDGYASVDVVLGDVSSSGSGAPTGFGRVIASVGQGEPGLNLSRYQDLTILAVQRFYISPDTVRIPYGVPGSGGFAGAVIEGVVLFAEGTKYLSVPVEFRMLDEEVATLARLSYGGGSAGEDRWNRYREVHGAAPGRTQVIASIAGVADTAVVEVFVP